MGNIGKITAGAGLLALGAVLGIGGYGRFGHSPADTSMPSTAPANQAQVSPSAEGTTVTDAAPISTNPSPQPLAPGAVPILKQQLNQPQPNVPLRAQQGTYAPVAAPETPVAERTVTTTTEKTAYVPPSTTYHRAYVYQRVRNEAPGNIHVARALKHTLAFSVKFPFRLRF
jgi:hypothetical protein